MLVEQQEIKEGIGNYWWISVLKAFTGGDSNTSTPPDDANRSSGTVRWL